jgi:osmotically inducible lipoprotein OsmB
VNPKTRQGQPLGRLWAVARRPGAAGSTKPASAPIPAGNKPPSTRRSGLSVHRVTPFSASKETGRFRVDLPGDDVACDVVTSPPGRGVRKRPPFFVSLVRHCLHEVRNMNKFTLVLLASLTLAACATPVQTAGTTAGAVGGGLVGGPVGAVVGGAAGAVVTAPWSPFGGPYYYRYGYRCYYHDRFGHVHYRWCRG